MPRRFYYDSAGRLVTGTFIMPTCGGEYCIDAMCQRSESDFGADGYDSRGYDREGRDREGRDSRGYDREGYDREGYGPYGFNRDGYNRDGFDLSGFNADGIDADGYDRDGFNEDGYDREGYDRNGEDDYGDHRPDPYVESGRLHHYSYTPEPLKFRGDAAPFYGMEIEITTDFVSRLLSVVDEFAGPLIYCKEDGSVAGAEMVTHPMSFPWAMDNFPWDMLPELEKRADAQALREENGIHIHVGRDGFAGEAHEFRWLKFWYRNPNDIQRIARRRESHWAAFSDAHRAAQLEHVKRNKPGYRERRDDTIRQRYSAINTSNEATFEVRVFASTLRPDRAKAALQLVAGTVEYTRQLTAADVCQRGGWAWGPFIEWADAQGSYADLVSENTKRRYR